MDLRPSSFVYRVIVNRKKEIYEKIIQIAVSVPRLALKKSSCVRIFEKAPNRFDRQPSSTLKSCKARGVRIQADKGAEDDGGKTGSSIE
jgi:hypothetical protein